MSTAGSGHDGRGVRCTSTHDDPARHVWRSQQESASSSPFSSEPLSRRRGCILDAPPPYRHGGRCRRTRSSTASPGVHLKTKGSTDVVTQKIRIGGGGHTGWHSHPGPVLVTIKSGATAASIYADDATCAGTLYEAGDSFIDRGDENVHIARNARSLTERRALGDLSRPRDAATTGVPDRRNPAPRAASHGRRLDTPDARAFPPMYSTCPDRQVRRRGTLVPPGGVAPLVLPRAVGQTPAGRPSEGEEREMSDQVKYVLDESRLPEAWYNIAADLPEPPPPVLHPGTGQPVGPDDLAPLFPMAIIGQEVSTDRLIAIPEEVRSVYRQWRPTPLYRARRLETLARDARTHLLQVRGRLADRVAQAEHRGRAGVLQQARGREAPHDRDGRRSVGLCRSPSQAGSSGSRSTSGWCGSRTTRSRTGAG